MYRSLQLLVAAGMLAGSLLLVPSGDAQAGVITIVLDDFNGSALATPGVSGITVLGNPDGRTPPITATPSAGVFAIDLGTNVSGSVSLTYGTVNLPDFATQGKVSYRVTFSNIGNDPSTVSGVAGNNTVTVSGGVPNTFPSLPNLVFPTGVTADSLFTGGLLQVVFASAGSRSWDMSIDQLELSFQCANLADQRYDVTGSPSAPVSGLSAYLNGAPTSCQVPIPSSAFLLAAGLLPLALLRRRR